MAGSYNIVTTQGDTFNFNCVVKTNDTEWNFTGYTAKMQVRESTSSSTKLLDLSTGSGITLNSVGQISITAPSSLTSLLPTGRLVYDLEVTSASGEKTTILSGKFIVSGQVSE